MGNGERQPPARGFFLPALSLFFFLISSFSDGNLEALTEKKAMSVKELGLVW